MPKKTSLLRKEASSSKAKKKRKPNTNRIVISQGNDKEKNSKIDSILQVRTLFFLCLKIKGTCHEPRS